MRICRGLKLGKEERNWIFSSSWTQSSGAGAAGKIDPITSAEGKVSILNDSLTTNKGRTRPGSSDTEGCQFVLPLAVSRQWHGPHQAAKQLSRVFPRVSLSSLEPLHFLTFSRLLLRYAWNVDSHRAGKFRPNNTESETGKVENSVVCFSNNLTFLCPWFNLLFPLLTVSFASPF